MLVGLLGYRPRPAVAAQVRLAVKPAGGSPIVLPAGLAVRSSAFGHREAPVFEHDADTRVHPLLNGWRLAPTRPSKVRKGARQLWLAPDTAKVRIGDHLLQIGGGPDDRHGADGADDVQAHRDDGAKYVRVTVDRKLTEPVTIAGSRLLRSVAVTPLWTRTTDPFTLTTAPRPCTCRASSHRSR